MIIKSIAIKNFLSVGEVTESIQLAGEGLTLISGENLDMGGGANKNGVGKSLIGQAICFGLYGRALTNIRVDNLINNINKKNMFVQIEFESNGHNYKIERGRKPAHFKFYVDDNFVTKDDENDEAQGENRETQKEIDKIIGMTHPLFRQIVLLNTFTEPFLALSMGDQRKLIEELFGITQLSQKAESLKELTKVIKQAIDMEDMRIKTVIQSNDRILQTVRDFELKAKRWDSNHASRIEDLSNSIIDMGAVDIDQEIENHIQNEKYYQIKQKHDQLLKDLKNKERFTMSYNSQLTNLIGQLSKISKKNCPMCNQEVDGHKHDEITNNIETQILEVTQKLEIEETEYSHIKANYDLIAVEFNKMNLIKTYYSKIDDARDHKTRILSLATELERVENEVNPYIDQTDQLKDTMQEVDYETINELSADKEHQDFLYKLLTSKESFIRKRIIDQNLLFLNSRLTNYLVKLGLSHNVKFNNDLSVEISILGQDLDFDSLSRGERTRLILGLSWAFRDMFENTSQEINLMFVDELLDNGLDGSGIENSVEILKHMARDNNKNVFVISHREELVPRVSKVLTAIKENNFTSFSWEWDN